MGLTSNGRAERSESAIDDEQNDEDMDDDEDTAFKNLRMRRASEGQHLMKESKKGQPSDLKCEHCGKGYKHSSCLSKHKCVGTLLSPVQPMDSVLGIIFQERSLIFLSQMGAHSRMVSHFKIVSHPCDTYGLSANPCNRGWCHSRAMPRNEFQQSFDQV